MAVSLLPYPLNIIGKTILLQWLYSFYSFDYKFNTLKLKTEESIELVESKWAYFSGYGFMFTVCTIFWPTLMSFGFYAFLFPLLVCLSVESDPESMDLT